MRLVHKEEAAPLSLQAGGTASETKETNDESSNHLLLP